MQAAHALLGVHDLLLDVFVHFGSQEGVIATGMPFWHVAGGTLHFLSEPPCRAGVTAAYFAVDCRDKTGCKLLLVQQFMPDRQYRSIAAFSLRQTVNLLSL